MISKINITGCQVRKVDCYFAMGMTILYNIGHFITVALNALCTAYEHKDKKKNHCLSEHENRQ